MAISQDRNPHTFAEIAGNLNPYQNLAAVPPEGVNSGDISEPVWLVCSATTLGSEAMITEKSSVCEWTGSEGLQNSLEVLLSSQADRRWILLIQTHETV